jgi:gamma-butyrobetaine dioxygenase
MDIVEQLIQLFNARGQGAYFGEAVSETEHALQCAHLAREAGADERLVAAALLHDVGHLLHGRSEDIADQGTDGQHEGVGAQLLARYFAPEVVAPVSLHVVAKRYLSAVEPEYLEQLSPASRLSLQLQGGPFSPEQVRRFERAPRYRDAVAVRRWDDQAKVPGLVVPGLETYRDCLRAALKE